MAMQFSDAVRNARANAVESTVGTSAVMKWFSGSVPANCAAANPSGLLATFSLPSDWMADASGGVKNRTGTWSATASGAGVAASFRIYASDGTTCHIQGTIAQVSGGDLNLDNTNIAVNQTVSIPTTFQWTEGGA